MARPEDGGSLCSFRGCGQLEAPECLCGGLAALPSPFTEDRPVAQPSISKPKTLGTRLLSFPDKWMGREHLQGMTFRGGGHFTYKNKANRTATSAW